jgi:putative radical SAM enzyme (TIGR03279 family)
VAPTTRFAFPGVEWTCQEVSLKPHSMTITGVEPDGLGASLGLRPGERVTHIDGIALADPLDFQFRSADERGVLTVIDEEGVQRDVEYVRTYGQPFGLRFDGMAPRVCGNKCVFCFVDQNAPDARASVRIRDEDFRLSFLYGNYITMTNLMRRDVDRIVEQHLTPLYVSVHATDPDVRTRLLGGQKRARELMPMMRMFIDHGIQMHTQIVMCPTWNDGEILDRSIEDLAALYPGVLTLSVVPVGLTAYRAGLPEIPPVTPQIARATRDRVVRYQKRFMRELGTRFVFLSDEFYVRLGEEPPPASQYEGYPLLENGCGMLRKFEDDWIAGRIARGVFTAGEKVAIVTGQLAAKLLHRTVVADLREAGVGVELIPILNRYLGASVTAAGLVAGRDIEPQVQARGEFDAICLPPNCLNPAHVFIDDTPAVALEERLRARLYLGLDLRVTEIPPDWRPGQAAEEGMTPSWSGGA